MNLADFGLVFKIPFDERTTWDPTKYDPTRIIEVIQALPGARQNWQLARQKGHEFINQHIRAIVDLIPLQDGRIVLYRRV